MQNITKGHLRVLTYSHIYTFPKPVESPQTPAENDLPDLKAELRVISDVFWIRLALMGDLGFAEAYMYGEVECDDLVSLFLVRKLQFSIDRFLPQPNVTPLAIPV